MNKKPIVLVVMDGVGKTDKDLGNMVMHAYTPTLDEMMRTCSNNTIQAHGTAVGLPSDEDMGNSEVGHNALGCGQIYAQGAKLVNESIESGKLFESATWKALTSRCVANKSTLHFIGLLSDGNVHSNISHLKALIANAKKQGVANVRVHALLDGRDVPATSALQYVDDIEAFMASLNDDTFHACIASGGGRMKVTMDRYQANWPMVKLGWETHVHGVGRQFASARDAVETYRNEDGAFVRGYIRTKTLRTVEPNTTYGLVVDKAAQTLTVFKDGERIGSCDVTTGEPTVKYPQRETPAGEYITVTRRGTWEYYSSGYTKYTIRINGGYYLSEIPTTKKNGTNFSMLEDALGEKATRGSICLPHEPSTDGGINAEWIWNMTDANKKVKVLIFDDKDRSDVPVSSK